MAAVLRNKCVLCNTKCRRGLITVVSSQATQQRVRGKTYAVDTKPLRGKIYTANHPLHLSDHAAQAARLSCDAHDTQIACSIHS